MWVIYKIKNLVTAKFKMSLCYVFGQTLLKCRFPLCLQHWVLTSRLVNFSKKDIRVRRQHGESSGVLIKFHFLTQVVVTWVYSLLKSHQVIYVRWMYYFRRKRRRKEGIWSFISVYFHGTHTNSKRSSLFRNAHKWGLKTCLVILKSKTVTMSAYSALSDA